MVPFIKAFYLDGVSPATYYMCTSSASSITTANLDDNNWNGLLPGTGNKYETYKYKHVLSNGTSGDAVSMRSKIKNAGAIQIGLVKLNLDNNLNAEFTIEEVALTYRKKSPK